jgi:hypothetical protein
LALAACPAELPPAMRLTGLPDALVAGRTYTVALEPTGAGELASGAATISVLDRTGRGWSARYESARGLSQAFSVGLTGAPYVIGATYEERTCTRALAVSLPVERRIYAVAACARRALEPRTLVVRCGGRRLRLSDLRWTGWNRGTATGRGRLGGLSAKVTLSSPRECATLDGFVYTRARIVTRERTYQRIPVACPIGG